jgi:hypothetical protein
MHRATHRIEHEGVHIRANGRDDRKLARSMQARNRCSMHHKLVVDQAKAGGAARIPPRRPKRAESNIHALESIGNIEKVHLARDDLPP